LPVKSEAVFSKVVHAAFGQRRKTLRNALSSLCDDVDAWLVPLGIDPQRRGETLSVPEYVAAANAMPEKPDAGAA
jgi:16S rRNA (adenine1518-N6/adenine1519-N6)-dimethyltransferase